MLDTNKDGNLSREEFLKMPTLSGAPGGTGPSSSNASGTGTSPGAGTSPSSSTSPGSTGTSTAPQR